MNDFEALLNKYRKNKNETKNFFFQENEAKVNEFYDSSDSPEEINKSYAKDQKIFELKNELAKGKNIIARLKMENSIFKKTSLEYDENITKTQKRTQDLETLKKFYNSEIASLHTKILQTDQELHSKEKNIKDLSEILKKNNEKTNFFNDNKSFVENNHKELLAKLDLLKTEKERLEKNFENKKTEIQEKEELIQKFEKKFENLKTDLENEKEKNNFLIQSHEQIKSTLMTVNERSEVKRQKFEIDKERLFQAFESKKSENFFNFQETTKKRLSLAEQTSLTDLTKEEILRWQQRYSALETEVVKAKEKLEKMKKKEISIKNNLSAKDSIIFLTQSLMNTNNEPESLKDSEKFGVPDRKIMIHSRNIAELLNLIQEMKYRYKSSEEVSKCVSCFQLPNEYFLADPCGHLSCLDCKIEFDTICQQCSKCINGMVNVSRYYRIIQIFRNEAENIEKMKTSLESIIKVL